MASRPGRSPIFTLVTFLPFFAAPSLGAAAAGFSAFGFSAAAGFAASPFPSSFGAEGAGCGSGGLGPGGGGSPSAPCCAPGEKQSPTDRPAHWMILSQSTYGPR